MRPCYDVETIRHEEYPMLREETYLDHAGTTLYAKSLMERFAADMIENLYGNPHSASPSSQAATARVEDARLAVLDFFKADPAQFDVVFVANATAGVKLVMDSFRAGDGFVYGYHKDSHNSIIGVREVAHASRCMDDRLFEEQGKQEANMIPGRPDDEIHLYAYPAQSNFDGRRLPLSWCRSVRGGNQANPRRFILLDAAALVSTSQLDLSDAHSAPDFTVVSFNKIFGFPDLGALIVRKSSGDILRRRKYFGGGTVEVVVALENEQWHIPKTEVLHESLEDGTLPIHSIMALDSAIKVHKELYQSMDAISDHTTRLAEKLYSSLKSLKHANGSDVCRMYGRGENYGNKQLQGPIVPFNIMNSQGAWISNTEIQRLASVRKIHLRTGGMCNPGGVVDACEFAPWELSRNFLAGARCGGEFDVVDGKPLGVIRASFGAMSTHSDVERLVAFVREYYTEAHVQPVVSDLATSTRATNIQVESLTVYPIKSCGGYRVPAGMDWSLRPEGLAWDREWCFVNEANGQVLSQKRYPRMALIRPVLSLADGIMTIWFQNSSITVPLSSAPLLYDSTWTSQSRVCGDRVSTWRLKNFEHGNKFFSEVLGVQCALARFPSGGSGPAGRHAKAHLQKHQKPESSSKTPIAGLIGSGVPTPPASDDEKSSPPILLSNESPILLVNNSSVNALNKEILQHGGKPADARVFRANIVVGSPDPEDQQGPYAEDNWSSILIGQQKFTMLGSCRRCHMICIDQDTATKDQEPFSTLARTRKFDGKVFFGCHMCHKDESEGGGAPTIRTQHPTIRVGDPVVVTTMIGD